MSRDKVVKAAKWLIEQIIKKPSEDRTSDFLSKPQSTARLIWACEEIIENSNDWSLDKLNRELGIVMGLFASRLFEKHKKSDKPDYVSLLKVGTYDAGEGKQFLNPSIFG
jgi:hypothetical protein